MQIALFLHMATLGSSLAAAYAVGKRQSSQGSSLPSCSQSSDVLPLAGSAMFFDSSNITDVCHVAHLSSLDFPGAEYEAKIERGFGNCPGSKVGSITLPHNMSGMVRIDWFCDDDKMRPCTVLSVLSASPSQTPSEAATVIPSALSEATIAPTAAVNSAQSPLPSMLTTATNPSATSLTGLRPHDGPTSSAMAALPDTPTSMVMATPPPTLAPSGGVTNNMGQASEVQPVNNEQTQGRVHTDAPAATHVAFPSRQCTCS